MTNHWSDIQNADLVLIMGGNAAEAHPCGFKWVTEAKARNKARLVVVDAQQRGNEMLGKQRDLFEARLTERAASPLSRTFWANLAAAWPADLARLQPLVSELGTALARQGVPVVYDAHEDVPRQILTKQ